MTATVDDVNASWERTCGFRPHKAAAPGCREHLKVDVPKANLDRRAQTADQRHPQVFGHAETVANGAPTRVARITPSPATNQTARSVTETATCPGAYEALSTHTVAPRRPPVIGTTPTPGHSAWERYGRGSGTKARLTYGDCFSYAAARVADEPLLFKGDHFTHTDIPSAI